MKWKMRCSNCIVRTKLPCRGTTKSSDPGCPLWSPDPSIVSMQIKEWTKGLEDLTKKELEKLSWLTRGVLPDGMVKVCPTCWWQTRPYNGSTCQEENRTNACSSWYWEAPISGKPSSAYKNMVMIWNESKQTGERNALRHIVIRFLLIHNLGLRYSPWLVYETGSHKIIVQVIEALPEHVVVKAQSGRTFTVLQRHLRNLR